MQYLILMLSAFSSAYAAQLTSHVHSSHVPIGVMFGHNHQQGDWMLSYRYGRMEMDGNRNGRNDVSRAQVLADFRVTPLDMTMEVHMFGVMYGVSDKITLMGMLPYLRKSMNHVNRRGVNFATGTDGIGDIRLSGLFTLYEQSVNDHFAADQQKLLFNFGVSLPAGNVDERGNTPVGHVKLPYPMQLGSGTVAPLMGLTYVNENGHWSWGVQANTVLHFGKNDEGYRLGNEGAVTTWLTRSLSPYISVSLRLDGKTWANIKGQDNDLDPTMVATARADLRGGERIDALLSVNLFEHQGILAGNRLAVEFGRPVYQDLDGPQLAVDYRFMIGWQFTLR